MSDKMREEISLVMRGYVYETGIIKASDIDAIIDEIMQACAAELATLREKAAEADELRKDAERLQFMLDETAILMYSVGIDRTLCRVEWPLTNYVQDAFYQSERAAIDAAIAQGKGE